MRQPIEDRRSSRLHVLEHALRSGIGGVEHHGVAQGVDEINAVRISRALAHGQQGEQRSIGGALANHDQIRVRLLQFLKIAAIAIADENPLHPLHLAIEREAHLARVV